MHMGVSDPLKFQVYLVLLVTVCQPRPVNTPGCAGELWRICDGVELARAILDACGQRPIQGTAVQSPCNAHTRIRQRDRRDVTSRRGGDVPAWITTLIGDQLDEMQDRGALVGDTEEVDAKATRQTPLPGGDDVILDDNTDPPGGDDVRLGDPPDSEPRRKRSLRNPWYRILNDLHQRCCMDGCSDEDLMQLC